MKKTKIFLLICFFICFVISTGLAFTGCTNKYVNLTKENLAEVRHNLYAGETDNLSVTFMSGYREKDYVINGYNTQLIEFGVVTINLKNDNISKSDTANYVLLVNTNRYEGECEINPFDGSYVADIKQLVSQDADISLKFTIGSFTEEIALNNVSSAWKIDYNEALNIACKQLKPQLKKMINGTFMGETYIKIIYDNKIQSGEYFWFVNFVGRTGTTHSVIIHPNTGEVLAKK